MMLCDDTYSQTGSDVEGNHRLALAGWTRSCGYSSQALVSELPLPPRSVLGWEDYDAAFLQQQHKRELAHAE